MYDTFYEIRKGNEINLQVSPLQKEKRKIILMPHATYLAKILTLPCGILKIHI